MAKSEYTSIGFVIKPHGLKGDMAIKLEQTAVERYPDFKTVFFHMNGAYVPFVLEASAALNKDKAKFKLFGINSSAEVETYRGMELFQLTKLLGVEKSTDLTGFLIVNKAGEELGSVLEVMENQRQPLLVIEHKGREAYIPLVDDFILEIKLKETTIQVELPEGLLDV